MELRKVVWGFWGRFSGSLILNYQNNITVQIG